NFPNAWGATEFPYRQDQSDVCTLSGWVSLPFDSPIRPITGRPSLPPTSPSPCPIPFLTVGIPPKREAWGFPSWRQRSGGRGRLEPRTRWESRMPPRVGTSRGPTHFPFGLGVSA